MRQHFHINAERETWTVHAVPRSASGLTNEFTAAYHFLDIFLRTISTGLSDEHRFVAPSPRILALSRSFSFVSVPTSLGPAVSVVFLERSACPFQRKNMRMKSCKDPTRSARLCEATRFLRLRNSVKASSDISPRSTIFTINRVHPRWGNTKPRRGKKIQITYSAKGTVRSVAHERRKRNEWSEQLWLDVIHMYMSCIRLINVIDRVVIAADTPL